MLESLFNLSCLQLYEKVTLTKMFSCEYCEIFKNNYFEEHLRASAFVHNFLVNALRACLIRPSFENTLSIANLPILVFLDFFGVSHLNIFFSFWIILSL